MADTKNIQETNGANGTAKRTRSNEPSIYTKSKHNLVALVSNIKDKGKAFFGELDSEIWKEASALVAEIGESSRSTLPLKERLALAKAAVNEHWANMPIENGKVLPPTDARAIEWQNTANRLIGKRDRLQREFDAEKEAKKNAEKTETQKA